MLIADLSEHAKNCEVYNYNVVLSTYALIQVTAVSEGTCSLLSCPVHHVLTIECIEQTTNDDDS